MNKKRIGIIAGVIALLVILVAVLVLRNNSKIDNQNNTEKVDT